MPRYISGPSAPQTSRIEQLHAALAELPPSINGDGGSAAFFNAACTAARFHVKYPDQVSEAEARAELQTYNTTMTNGEPWEGFEFEHKWEDALAKVRAEYGAGGSPSPQVGGRKSKRAATVEERAAEDAAIRARAKAFAAAFAPGEAGSTPEEWRAASPVTGEALDEPTAFLSLYGGEDSLVNIVTEARQNADGKWVPANKGRTTRVKTWRKGQLAGAIKAQSEDYPTAGAWARTNTMKNGGITDEDVATFHHVLVESDKIPVEAQGSVLWKLKGLGFPIVALISSGGASWHAWLSVHAENADEFSTLAKRIFATLEPLAIDSNNSNPSRLSRLPCAMRGGKKQELLYLNPDAEPLTEEVLARIESEVARVSSPVAVDEPVRAADAEDCEVLPPEPMACPVESLPDIGARVVRDCERIKCPDPGVGLLAVLGTASAAIGRGLQSRLSNGYVVRPNLSILGVYSSGNGKSEVLNECAAPLTAAHKAYRAKWEEETLPALKTEKRNLEAAIAASTNKKRGPASHLIEALGGNNPVKWEARLAKVREAMLPPKFRMEDATTPSLIDALHRDGQIWSMSVDARTSMDMLFGKHSNGAADDSVFIKGYSLDDIQHDRRGTERSGPVSITIEKACVAMLWFVQQDKLATMVDRPEFVAGGLIPRLLMHAADIDPLFFSKHQKQLDAEVMAEYGKRIQELFRTFRLRPKPVEIAMDLRANDLLIEYQNEVARRMMGDLRDARTLATRWAENAGRLALVCHALTHGKDAENHPLSLSAARSGVELMRWFAHNQLEILGSKRDDAKKEKHDKVVALLRKKGGKITSRDVQRGLKIVSAEADMILKEMCDAAKLVEEERKAKSRNAGAVYVEAKSRA